MEKKGAEETEEQWKSLGKVEESELERKRME